MSGKDDPGCVCVGTLIRGRWHVECDCGWTAETDTPDPAEAGALQDAHVALAHVTLSEDSPLYGG